jgi:Ca-activated chloride channel family protein
MKTSTFLLILFFICRLTTFGQGTMDYTLTVKNKAALFANANVVFTETSTRERIEKKTNAEGKVNIVLDHGAEWSISVEEVKHNWFITVPPRGQGTGSQSIHYDIEEWKRENRPPVDRLALNLQTIPQNLKSSENPTEQEAIVNVILKGLTGNVHPNHKVELTCYKLKKTFAATSDAQGIARFKIPVNNEYEIDLDGVPSYDYIDIRPGAGIYNRGITFEPTKIKETHAGDTIVQQLALNQGGTSTHALFKLKVKNMSTGSLDKEDVYLKMLKSNTVYKAKTNKEGEAVFLLPIHQKYLIDFNFEKDVDVLDLSRVFGISNGEMELAYRPDPRLQFPERYLPKPNEVFIGAFESFIEKQFPEPTDQYLKMYTEWATPEVNENSKEAIMEIGFATQKKNNVAKLKKNIPGPPINISFVIDKSGSMAGYDRIESLIISLTGLVDQLRPTDIVSIVTFSNDAQLVYPAKIIGDGILLKEIISEIVAGGGTQIYTGLEMGFLEVLKNFKKGNTNKVVLLTDGFGSRPIEEVIAMSRTYVAKGIEVSAIGVGTNYNQSLLSQLATVGGGLMHYVGDAKNMNEAFNREMKSCLYPIAKDALIEVFYNDKCVFRQLYGYPFTEPKTDQFNMAISNIYPGLNKLALIKFDLDQPTKEIEKQAIRIKMTYHDFEQEKVIVQEEKRSLKWTDKTGKTDLLIDRNHKKLYAVGIMNQSIKVMAEAHAAGDNDRARKIILETMDQIKDLFPESDDADVKELMIQMQGYVFAFDQIMKNLERKKN